MLRGFRGSIGIWFQVLEAYKLGVAALKSTLKGSGLTEDSVADTMVQVEEVSWYKNKPIARTVLEDICDKPIRIQSYCAVARLHGV
jgi:hypothetical protein